MKKLLLSAIALVASAFVATAAESTLDYTKLCSANTVLDGVTLTTDEGVSVVASKNGGSTAPQYYTTGTALRMYAKNCISITAPNGATITGITMALREYSYEHEDATSGPCTASTGTFTADYTGYTATWTGTTTDPVVITVPGDKNANGKNCQLGICSITVTYTAGVETKCATPKFSVAEGTYYTPQSVEVSTSTADAKIYLTVKKDGNTMLDNQEWATALPLSQVGTYEVSAYAAKEGLENSEVATATYTIANPIAVNDFEELIIVGGAEPKGTLFKLDFEFTVVRQMPNNTYVKDAAQNPMLIYGNQVPTFEAGDVVPTGVLGEFTTYNGLYEFTYPVAESFGEVTKKADATPVVMAPGAITMSDLNKVVYLDNVTYNDKDNGKSFSTTDGSIAWYTQSKWTDVVLPETNGKVVDVIAAVACYEETLQVYPIEFLDASATPGAGSVNTIVADAASIRTSANGIVVNANEAAVVNVFNAAGQLVKAAHVAAGETTIAVPTGFYLVKVANTVAKVIVK